MSVVVVGSVAYDGVETPHGKVERMLGGACTYIALASSYFAKTKIVAVVGDDFDKQFEESGVQDFRDGPTHAGDQTRGVRRNLVPSRQTLHGARLPAGKSIRPHRSGRLLRRRLYRISRGERLRSESRSRR